MSEWIAVTQALPEPGVQVLVTPGFVEDVSIDVWVEGVNCFLSTEIESGPRVTHWMHKPAPPGQPPKHAQRRPGKATPLSAESNDYQRGYFDGMNAAIGSIQGTVMRRHTELPPCKHGFTSVHACGLCDDEGLNRA